MQSRYVIKIGGHVIDDEKKLSVFLHGLAAVKGKKILVHGGGKLATDMAQQLGLPQQMVDGRRITDAETLKVVTMVYAGLVNKNVVAKLQAQGAVAIGLCGADGDLVRAHKRVHPSIDYGFVGDIDAVNTGLLEVLLHQGLLPVIAPVSHDGEGGLLNTNADTVAQEIAVALSASHQVTLIYGFEKKGVLKDVNDGTSVIPSIKAASYALLKEQQVIHTGMIPKLDNAFSALRKGVGKVVIGMAEELEGLISGSSGTTIINE